MLHQFWLQLFLDKTVPFDSVRLFFKTSPSIAQGEVSTFDPVCRPSYLHCRWRDAARWHSNSTAKPKKTEKVITITISADRCVPAQGEISTFNFTGLTLTQFESRVVAAPSQTARRRVSPPCVVSFWLTRVTSQLTAERSRRTQSRADWVTLSDTLRHR